MSDEQEYDFVSNKDIEVPDEIPDFGDLLRRLRHNHGFTLQQLSKSVGLPVTILSEIELSKKDLPSENILRAWLNKLGCGRNTNKLLAVARQYRVKHWISLNRKESCNPSILRIIDAYKNGKLTDYDRALLRLVAVH